MTYLDHLEDYNNPCPHCDHTPTHYKDCDNIFCEEGTIDLFEKDPLWYSPNETANCRECHGTTIICWCPACGQEI